MKHGDRGPQVKILQRRLNEWIKQEQAEGRHCDVRQLFVDGSYGDNTRYVVALYQKANDIYPSGVVDEETAGALGVSTDPSVDVITTSGGGV